MVRFRAGKLPRLTFDPGANCETARCSLNDSGLQLAVLDGRGLVQRGPKDRDRLPTQLEGRRVRDGVDSEGQAAHTLMFRSTSAAASLRVRETPWGETSRDPTTETRAPRRSSSMLPATHRVWGAFLSSTSVRGPRSSLVGCRSNPIASCVHLTPPGPRHPPRPGGRTDPGHGAGSSCHALQPKPGVDRDAERGLALGDCLLPWPRALPSGPRPMVTGRWPSGPRARDLAGARPCRARPSVLVSRICGTHRWSRREDTSRAALD